MDSFTINGEEWQRRSAGDFYRTSQQMDYLKDKAEREWNTNEQHFKERFVWLIFNIGEQLQKDLDGASLTRLLFAATYCDEHGNIGDREILKTNMRLETRTFDLFIEKVVQLGLMEVDNRKLKITQDLARFGILSDDVLHNEDIGFIRLFAKGLRDAYYSCPPKKHKQLSYILRVVPYLSNKNNALVHNPRESEMSKLNKLKFGELCDIIGYSRNNMKRLADDLLKMRISGENLIGFMAFDTSVQNWFIVVNPRICYGYDKNSNELYYLQYMFSQTKDKSVMDDYRKVL